MKNFPHTQLHRFLLTHCEKNPISFHMPGHKGRNIFKQYQLGNIAELIPCGDITEIPGADNLFAADGVIMAGQSAYAELYNCRHSFYSVNGSTAALMAAIFAGCPEGSKVIVARNSHRAVFNAIKLRKLIPVYTYPEPSKGPGVSISNSQIEHLLEKNPDVAAVILTSPDYYGNCCDIESIAETVHHHKALLIVDEAHGAHLHFFRSHTSQRILSATTLPDSAVSMGADFVINSIHKTLASFTQSAVLNMNTDRFSPRHILKQLELFESSSPSYILMASLDLNAALLKYHGAALFTQWLDDLNYFYSAAKKIDGIRLYLPGSMYDYTKINLAAIGITGRELENYLITNNIYPELTSGNMVMLMTGIGNKRSDYEHLLGVLSNIPKSPDKSRHVSLSDSSHDLHAPGFDESPYRSAVSASSIPVDSYLLEYGKSIGKVAAGSITAYPPGIPIVCPGEVITENAVKLIQKYKDSGTYISGIDCEDKIEVGK